MRRRHGDPPAHSHDVAASGGACIDAAAAGGDCLPAAAGGDLFPAAGGDFFPAAAGGDLFAAAAAAAGGDRFAALGGADFFAADEAAEGGDQFALNAFGGESPSARLARAASSSRSGTTWGAILPCCTHSC